MLNRSWTIEEIEYLKTNYLNKKTIDLSLYLNRSIDAIHIKAGRIGLKKDFYWNHEKFVDYVKNNSNDEYEVMTQFKSVGDLVILKHKICNRLWETLPSSFIYSGHRCNKCNKYKNFTHEEFINKLNSVNKNILVLDKYYNIKKKLNCKCILCKHEWLARPDSLLRGISCPKCGKHKIRTSEEFEKEIFEKNPNLLILGDFTTTKKKILVKCLIDNYEWYVKPESLIKGCGCPKCVGTAKPTDEDFRQKIFKINPDIEILDNYINHYTKLKIKCNNDGNIWMASPHTLLWGIGCPICSSSKGEKYCSNILKNNSIEYISQHSFNDLKSDSNMPLRFDFLVKDETQTYCIIEIDGIGHRKPIKFNNEMSEEDSIKKFELIHYHDKLKNEYCKNKNINLIRIAYTGKNFEEMKIILEKELSPLLERR
jgi:hypothetical protein